MKKQLISLLLGLLLVPIFAYSQIPAIEAEQTPTYCPSPDKLVKNGLWWHVDNSWKSYSESFVEKVTDFIEVQWIGVKVGTVICLYKGKDEFDFPVALEPTYPMTVLAPTGSAWQTTKEDYKKCVSNNVQDCPFYQQKKATTADLYEQIKYRGKKD